MAAAPQTPAVGSPDWWLARLYKKLIERQQIIDRFEDYYCGDHPLPWLPEQARQEFRRILAMTRTNVMGLVCDSTAERMEIQGFRIGDQPEADKETWRIWQANNLDSGFDQGILDALITGQSYLLVAPNPKDPKTPLAWMEHPSQAIVEAVPGSNGRERAAGLKVWIDDWTDQIMATLYLPSGLYKYQAQKPPAGLQMPSRDWSRRAVPGEAWPAPNALGVVPLIEIPNRPRTLIGGISELADVTDIQDRINKTVADRLITQDFGAFPQKWAIGWPDVDEQGNPATKIDVGRNRMVSTSAIETKFGQWDAAPLDPYSLAKKEDVKDIASRTRTPAQYLLGEMSNVNGETLKASESGLVSKVRQCCRYVGERAEDGVRLMRRAANLSGDDASMETIWRNPEYRTDAELVDALTKMAALGVPDEVLWQRWGATPQEIERWKSINAANASNDPVLLAAKQLAAPLNIAGTEAVGAPAVPAANAPAGNG